MDKTSSPTVNNKPIYKRVLLKLSGEALQSDALSSIDPAKLVSVSEEIAAIVKLGVQVALVIGGGNLVRGVNFHPAGFDRITADQMGMLATTINGLALADTFRKKSLPTHLFSAFAVTGIIDVYQRHLAISALEQNNVVIFVGGTGNPLVTTDSAAALRGIEMNADIVIKATKVDGVFASDPVKNPKAQRYELLKYEEVIEQRLGVMDLNAILLCRENELPLRVFNMNNQGALKRIILGENIGTLIQGGDKSHA